MNSIKTFFKERGPYLASLALVFAATAAGIFGIRNALRELALPEATRPNTVEEDDTWTQPDALANEPVTDLPKSTSAPSAQPSAAPPSSGAASQPTAGQSASAGSAGSSSPSAVWPVADGRPGAAFSGDTLVYNATLGDWRTHNGTDYTAAAGADVFAVAAGEVSAVYTDALWGTVVEVTSADGTLWKYCGLDKAAPARGDRVAGGDVLGTLAEALPAEADGGAHLHLERLQDGRWTDAAIER